MNNRTKIIALLVLVAGVVVSVFVVMRPSGTAALQVADAPRARREGNMQIIELTAKGGYSPRVIAAHAGIPSTLRVRTQSTFDCSSAFTVPALHIRAMLPPTGVTEFTIPAQDAGTELQMMCAMGMYRATIRFS